MANAEPSKPREIVEGLRAQFDSELEGAVVALELWNLRLRDAFASYTPENARELYRLAHEAKNDLDTNWSYYGDTLMVSGRWDITMAQEAHTGIQYRTLTDQPVFSLAVSNGFEIDFCPGDAPQVGFSFKHSQVSFANRHMHGRVELLSFARMGDVSLSLARKSEPLEAIKPREALETVDYYNNLLRLYTERPSNFYRKSASEQQQFLHSIVNDLSDRILTPPYDTLCEDIETPYLYRRLAPEDPTENSLEFEVIRGQENIQLTGRLVGFTILDTLFPVQQALRSKEDFLDPDAGICYIISVDRRESEDDEWETQDLLVPSRQVKHVNFSSK